MRSSPLGHHVEAATAGERFRAFVPAPLAHLERLGIVAEITHRRRGRVFSYRRQVDGLTAGVEKAPWAGVAVLKLIHHPSAGPIGDWAQSFDHRASVKGERRTARTSGKYWVV